MSGTMFGRTIVLAANFTSSHQPMCVSCGLTVSEKAESELAEACERAARLPAAEAKGKARAQTRCYDAREYCSEHFRQTKYSNIVYMLGTYPKHVRNNVRKHHNYRGIIYTLTPTNVCCL